MRNEILRRQSAGRARRDGEPESTAEVTVIETMMPGLLERSTARALGDCDTPAAVAALDLARRLDSTPAASAAAASLHREMRNAIAAALDEAHELDIVDELRARVQARFGRSVSDGPAAP
ncbi:MAG: hypothetical protein WAN48_15750 [Actinomycetes bacterium]